MIEDKEEIKAYYYKALVARNSNYDGIFFVGIKNDRDILPCYLPCKET